jgi:serine/threonine protein kinase
MQDGYDVVARHYSLECDVWSFGVCLYRVCLHFFLFLLYVFSPSSLRFLWHQLTTGQFPFDGASSLQVLELIRLARVPPVGGGFSEALKTAITRMLEKVFFCLWEVVFFLLFAGAGEEADS